MSVDIIGVRDPVKLALGRSWGRRHDLTTGRTAHLIATMDGHVLAVVEETESLTDAEHLEIYELAKTHLHAAGLVAS